MLRSFHSIDSVLRQTDPSAANLRQSLEELQGLRPAPVRGLGLEASVSPVASLELLLSEYSATSQAQSGLESPATSPERPQISLDGAKGLDPLLPAPYANSSDSDGGRSKTTRVFDSLGLDSEAPKLLTPQPRRKKAVAKQRKSAPRRRSRVSDVLLEKSHRLDSYPGSGYTVTPAAGKVFRNLLILEESLRQQVMQQRALRRKYLSFLAAVLLVIAGAAHLLYFGLLLGTGRVLLQLVVLMLLVTLVLYHLLGEYYKTIVLPRRFIASTNKGLRQLNVRLVKTRSSFANSTADLLRELGLFLCTMALKLLHTAAPLLASNPAWRLEVFLVSGQLRCQPRFGLNDVKLVLVPRSFTTDIREGWELYRDEFWIKEGLRRRKAMLNFTEKRPKKDRKDRRKLKLTPQSPVLAQMSPAPTPAITPAMTPALTPVPLSPQVSQ